MRTKALQVSVSLGLLLVLALSVLTSVDSHVEAERVAAEELTLPSRPGLLSGTEQRQAGLDSPFRVIAVQPHNRSPVARHQLVGSMEDMCQRFAKAGGDADRVDQFQ